MPTSDQKKPGKSQAAPKDPSKKGDLAHKPESEHGRPPMKQQEHKK